MELKAEYEKAMEKYNAGNEEVRSFFLLMSPIALYLGFLCMGALIMIYSFVAGASDHGWRGLKETWS